MLIELDQARERIKPLEDLLIEALKAATGRWSTLVRELPDFAVPLDAIARAKFIHCHARNEIDQRVGARHDAVVNDRLGFYALWLRPDVLLRVKYVGNSDAAPQNYPTRQQRLLARQSYDGEMLELLGLDEAPTLLTCGYTLLDELDLGLVEIRCDCRGHLPWSYSIYGDSVGMEPLVFEGMADETKPARVTSSRKAHGKDDEQAEGE